MPWTEKLKSGLWQHQNSALVVLALLTTLLFPVAKAPRNIAAAALILCALIGISVLRNPPQKLVYNRDFWAFALVFGSFTRGPGVMVPMPEIQSLFSICWPCCMLYGCIQV
jgi:hypothetical protein